MRRRAGPRCARLLARCNEVQADSICRESGDIINSKLQKLWSVLSWQTWAMIPIASRNLTLSWEKETRQCSSQRTWCTRPDVVAAVGKSPQHAAWRASDLSATIFPCHQLCLSGTARFPACACSRYHSLLNRSCKGFIRSYWIHVSPAIQVRPEPTAWIHTTKDSFNASILFEPKVHWNAWHVTVWLHFIYIGCVPWHSRNPQGHWVIEFGLCLSICRSFSTRWWWEVSMLLLQKTVWFQPRLEINFISLAFWKTSRSNLNT